MHELALKLIRYEQAATRLGKRDRDMEEPRAEQLAALEYIEQVLMLASVADCSRARRAVRTVDA